MPPKSIILDYFFFFFYILADDIWIQKYCFPHKNKTKTPPPFKKKNKQKTTKLSNFYRAIRVILERVYTKKPKYVNTYVWLTLSLVT